MRIVYMGTGDIGVPTLRHLVCEGKVVGVVTQPDRPVGRHQILTPPIIKVQAKQAGIPVLQPQNMRDPAAIDALRALRPDLLVVFAYGQILNQEVIDMPPMGCINVHASLLPRHRGAACIQATIDSGDKEAGISIIYVEKRLDAGSIIAQHKIEMHEFETGDSLHDEIAERAPLFLLHVINTMCKMPIIPTLQDDSLATHANKLRREHGLIDWTQSAEAIARRIRAYHPWPGSHTTYLGRHGRMRTLKIFPHCQASPNRRHGNHPRHYEPGEVISADESGLIIACGTGELHLKDVQPDGSRRMSAGEFVVGHSITKRRILGTEDKGGNVES